jgi:hypothetical protein
MLLTTQQSYDLLAKHGSYITEICDACGKGLGPVRYTRRGDSGVWCSRECRDGKEAHAPGTCKGCGVALASKRRGTRFCSNTCRKRDAKQSVPDLANYRGIAAHSKGLTEGGRGFGCPYTPKPFQEVNP